MSYCRWSCDDHQSDVYVYQTHQAYVIALAARKRRIDRTLLPPEVDLREDVTGYLARRELMYTALEAAPYEALTLEGAGETFEYDTAREAVEALEDFRARGFHVPQHALDNLREDIT